MSADSSFVLKSVIEQSRQKDYPSWKPDKYFELFASQQALKMRRFNPDPIETESGIIGGNDDGGVDGFYLFVNRRFIREDTDPAIFKDQQIACELLIVQAKNTSSFEESVPQKFKDFAEQCLPLGATLGPAQQALYSQSLLTAVKKFHDVFKQGLLKHPKLTITFCHVSLGEDVNPKVQTRANMVLERIREIYTTADCSYEHVTGSRLLNCSISSPNTPFPSLHQSTSIGRRLIEVATFV